MASKEKMSPKYLRAKKQAKKTGAEMPEPDDLDWAYIFENEKLREITKTINISSFCKIQHLKYIAHVSRLENNALQKQLLFKTEHKKYSRNPWIKMEKELNISREQIQRTMQNKKEFVSLLHLVF